MISYTLSEDEAIGLSGETVLVQIETEAYTKETVEDENKVKSYQKTVISSFLSEKTEITFPIYEKEAD